MSIDIPETVGLKGMTLPGMTRAESGLRVLTAMLEIVGRTKGISILDVGCGDRFTRAILDYDLPVTYCGVESRREIVEWLSQNITDPRFSFHHYDAYNARYSPEGKPISKGRSLGDFGQFDVVLAQSVLTHMTPHEADVTLHLMRRHVKPDGRLLFTYLRSEAVDMFEDMHWTEPLLRFHYHPQFMARLARKNGWAVIREVPATALMQTAMLCAPAEAPAPPPGFGIDAASAS